MIPRSTTELIIIHCSYTTPDMDVGVRTIRDWHKERGFDDVGYHYIIRRDGTVEEGRPVSLTGAHASGRNSTSIGICLVGGAKSNGKSLSSDCNFTPEQFEAMSRLVDELKTQYPKINQVTGHNVFSSKDCPTFSVDAWFSYGEIIRIENNDIT